MKIFFTRTMLLNILLLAIPSTLISMPQDTKQDFSNFSDFSDLDDFLPKKKAAQRAAPAQQVFPSRHFARTPQEQREQSLGDFFEKTLKPLADNLNKIIQSKEAKQAVEARKKERDRKIKEAEQKRKAAQSQSSSNPWRSGGGGGGYRGYQAPTGRGDYGGSGYSGGGYGGGYGRGYDGRHAGYNPSSGYSSPHSQSSPSSPYTSSASNNAQNYDDDDDQKSSDDRKDKDRNRSGPVAVGNQNEEQKEAGKNYAIALNAINAAITILTNHTKEAAEASKDAAAKDAFAKAMLSGKWMSNVEKQLEKSQEAESALSRETLNKLEGKGEKLKKAKAQLNSHYRTYFPHALRAATVQSTLSGEQESVKSIIEDKIKTAIPAAEYQAELNKMDTELRNTWAVRRDAALKATQAKAARVVKALAALRSLAPTPLNPRDEQEQKDALAEYQALEEELGDIIKKMPIGDGSETSALKAEQAKIAKLRDDIQ